MANNKVTLADGTVLIDLTNSTLNDASQLQAGVTAYDRSGALVTGSLVIQHYYTGSSAPSASTGVNGDIYLQTS